MDRYRWLKYIKKPPMYVAPSMSTSRYFFLIDTAVTSENAHKENEVHKKSNPLYLNQATKSTTIPMIMEKIPN